MVKTSSTEFATHRISRFFAPHHAFRDAVVEEHEQRVIKAIHVDEHDGLVMQPQRLPREHLEQLLKRTVSAGQRDEGVGAAADELLAGVHGAGHVQLGQALVRDFEVDQHLRDHAHDVSTGREGRVRHGLHQAHACAAVDEAKPALRKAAAKFLGGRAVERAGTIGGGAEDGNVGDPVWLRHNASIISASPRPRFAPAGRLPSKR